MPTFLYSQGEKALGDRFFKLPATGNRFLPIRSGIAKLNQVRIVDTFGRYKDLSCKDLLFPQKQLVGGTWYLPSTFGTACPT